MKAVTFHRHGGPEQLTFEDVPLPALKAGEVLVRVKACALNHLDIWVRQGIPNYTIPLPHISGCDVSGVVERIGEGTDAAYPIGQSVVISPGISCWQCEACLAGKDNFCPAYHLVGAGVHGGYAEYVKVPARNLLPMPSGLTFEQAAAYPLVSVTAWHMVKILADVRPGETVLVMGAGSGVGSMAIQLASLLEAQVISTVGTDDKIEKAQAIGAALVINHAREDVTQRVLTFTDGRGVDVVIEHIGQAVWDQCLRSLTRGGRLVTCGATSGPENLLDARYVYSRQLTIRGSYMGTRAELLEASRFIEAGTVQPVVDSVFPLSEARQAQERMLARKMFGKIILVPQPAER